MRYRTLRICLTVIVALAAPAALATTTACASERYTYNFVSLCPFPIWIGQHATGAKSFPPEGENWTLAPACTADSQCGSGQTCDGSKSSPGRCSCRTREDCPAKAACVGGRCSTRTTFCMPQTWSSGTFWPRTGCTPTAGGGLTCATGDCAGAFDCAVGGSPADPATQVELTTAPGSANYDVSANAGYNVETWVKPLGAGPPSSDSAACQWAGCVADLNATCPAALQVLSGGTVIGCLDPCTQCQRSNPAALNCGATITKDASGNTPAVTTPCSGTVTNGSLPTYRDMYCAKNFEGDGNAQASSNQGTPTAYAQIDCPIGTIFTTSITNFTPPAGMGVCVDPANPNYANASGTCSASTVGQGCGGYLIVGYPNALGYTCQAASYPSGGKTLTAYVCVPPVTSGLAACQAPSGQTALYQGVGGVFNAAWLTAGLQAGGGTTPYYQTFKSACPRAYTWQYDDASAGFACTSPALKGFEIVYCGRPVPLR